MLQMQGGGGGVGANNIYALPPDKGRKGLLKRAKKVKFLHLYLQISVTFITTTLRQSFIVIAFVGLHEKRSYYFLATLCMIVWYSPNFLVHIT